MHALTDRGEMQFQALKAVAGISGHLRFEALSMVTKQHGEGDTFTTGWAWAAASGHSYQPSSHTENPTDLHPPPHTTLEPLSEHSTESTFITPTRGWTVFPDHTRRWGCKDVPRNSKVPGQSPQPQGYLRDTPVGNRVQRH